MKVQARSMRVGVHFRVGLEIADRQLAQHGLALKKHHLRIASIKLKYYLIGFTKLITVTYRRTRF